MALADKLANVSNRLRPGPTCVIGSLLSKDSSMIDEDKRTLEYQMTVELTDQSRVSATVIKEALEEEGYIASISGITRHRSGKCGCFSRSNNFKPSDLSGKKK